MRPLQLGRPGVYQASPVPARRPAGMPMDVCGFVGVAPRGPARVPVVDEEWPGDRPCVEPGRPRRHAVAVPVQSWTEYRNAFGGFEGPGLLPYAVASFFEQGGRRAYVVRVVPDDGTKDQGVARGVLRARMPGRDGTMGLALRTRNEGSWGNRLAARLRFTARPLDASVQAGPERKVLSAPDGSVGTGDLLRLTFPSGRVFAFAGRTEARHDPLRGWGVVAQLQGVLPPGDVSAVEVIRATLEIRDTGVGADADPGQAWLRPGRPAGGAVTAPAELHADMGLHPDHPQWLAQVLCYGSNLVWPEAAWAYAPLVPEDLDLTPMDTAAPGDRFQGGVDRYGDITPDDLAPEEMALIDGQPRGVQALLDLADLSAVVVPDLYCAHPLLPPRPPQPEPRPARFTEALQYRLPPRETQVDLELRGLRLDPGQADDFERILALQGRLVALAEAQARFVVMLDVPPGLTQAQVLRWRARFSSSYAAAYHPWLLCGRPDDGRDGLVLVCPSAVAAGIVAQVERRSGLPTGPANVLAQAVVDTAVTLAPAWQDELHRQSINTFARAPGGVLLHAARTLSRDGGLRQLSVRRILLMLRRALERRTQWLAFENNTPELREALELSLTSYLGALHRADFFAGRGDSEAFFVRFAGDAPQDGNRLSVEIGVAPAQPMEYLMIRLSREPDGRLLVQEGAGQP